MGRWEELDQKRARQSGTGPGEFGSPTQEIEGNPDNPYQDPYSRRKRYQLGYGNETPSPLLKEYMDNVRDLEVGEEVMSEKHDDFQNKYVGYMVLALVLGVVGIGVIGLIYFSINGSY